MGETLKRTSFLVAGFVLACVMLAGVARQASAAETAKIRIIASLFPQYDFARRIAGDRADVRLLLPPGAESHSFEPTPSDMRDIASADVFIYTGDHMEPWAKRLADAAGTPGGVVIVDASRDVAHRGGEDDDHDHDEKHDHGDDHVHGGDPHIWLDPTLAKTMVETIADALSRRDPAGADAYKANAAALLAELTELDTWFRGAVDASPRRLLVFGERFAFGYFFDHYGLEVAGAYKSCAPGAEPGLKAVIEVVDTIKKNGVRYIYLEDMSTGRISEVLCNETGAEILRVDSLHNPAAARQEAGEGYVSIMRANMDAFAKGLR